MTLQEAAAQLKAVGAEWGTISKNTAQATTGTAAFLKEIAAPAGVIYALQKLAATRKDLTLKKEDADKMLPSNRLKAVVAEMNDIDRKLKPLQAKLASFTYPLTDKDREARERLRDKADPLFDRSDELLAEWKDLRSKVPDERLFSSLEKGLKDLEVGWLAAGTVIELTSHRLYGFNDVVKATNVSLQDRNALFSIATNQELRYGKNLTDIAQILDVARESGISMTASLDPLRKKLGQITMGNLASSLDQVIHLSLQAEDALGLTPDAIRNVIDASIQMNRPYQEVLDTITNINQGLGLTGEQSARIVSQISGQAFGFNIGGQAVEAVAKQVARLQAASKGLPVDQDFAVRMTERFSDFTTKQGGLAYAMSGGGANVLQDPKALMRSWEDAAKILRTGLGDKNLFGQLAQQFGYTRDEAAALIQVVDRMHRGFKDATLTGDTTAKVAENQLQRSGRIWGTFWNQLKGGFLLGLTIFNGPLEKVTGWITRLHVAMGGMSDGAKNAIKWVGGLTGSIILLAGAVEGVRGLTILAGVLSKSGWIMKGLSMILPTTLFKAVGGPILAFVRGLAGDAISLVAKVILPGIRGIVSAFGFEMVEAFLVIWPGLAVISAGLIAYGLARALGAGKIGVIIGDFIWKRWQAVENVAITVGSKLKTWFTDLFDWIADHIPGMGFLHSKGQGISTHTLSRNQVLAAQTGAAHAVFSNPTLTSQSGTTFINAQRRELLAALGAGTITPETARNVMDDDAKELSSRINSIVTSLARNKDMPAKDAAEQKALMQVMVELLAKLTHTADKDIQTYTRQHQDNQRASDLAQRRADEEAFKTRATTGQFSQTPSVLY